MTERQDRIAELTARHDQMDARVKQLQVDLETLRLGLDVLRLKEKGYSNVAIGKKLDISEGSIRSILKQGKES